MSHEWTEFYGWGRCADSGNSDMHAHLVGGNWINKEDLAPSAVLCVAFFLFIGGIGWRYYHSRVTILFVVIAAFLFTGLAFAIRAAIANTAVVNVNRTTILVDQAPTPANSLYPSLESSQMRVAAAVLPFILVSLFALLLPFAKVVAPELPGIELGLLTLVACFLWVPVFYTFCVTAITVDSSPLVCSQIFFYLALGLFQLLAIVPLLVLPMPRWGFTLAPHDLLPAGGVAAGPMMAAAAEDNHLHAAAADAAYARAREDEEARLLAEEMDVLHHNAGVARMHDDDVWDVHLT
ncbi:hypothetical protein JCM11641_007501 [Rhodosporidiobolus odoratus]